MLKNDFPWFTPLSQPMEVDDAEGASSASMLSQEVLMDAQPSTSGGGAAAGASSAATTTTIGSRPLLTRLRCESDCEDSPVDAETAAAHPTIPSGWLTTIISDVEGQKKKTVSQTMVNPQG